MGMILTTTSYGWKMWHHRFLMFPAMLVWYFVYLVDGTESESLYGEVWTPIPHLPSPQAVCTVCFGPVGIVCVTHKVLQAEEEYNKNTGYGRHKLWYAIRIMKMNSTYCFLSQTENLYTNLRINDVCVSDRSCSPYLWTLAFWPWTLWNWMQLEFPICRIRGMLLGTGISNWTSHILIRWKAVTRVEQ